MSLPADAAIASAKTDPGISAGIQSDAGRDGELIDGDDSIHHHGKICAIELDLGRVFGAIIKEEGIERLLEQPGFGRAAGHFHDANEIPVRFEADVIKSIEGDGQGVVGRPVFGAIAEDALVLETEGQSVTARFETAK